MKTILIGLFLILGHSTSYACDLEFKATKICGSIEFANKPKINVDSPFALSFDQTLPDGTLQPTFPSQQVEVELWMPGMGHGSKPTKNLVFPKLGVIAVTNAFFIMGGDWEIRVRLVETVNGIKKTVDSAAAQISL